MAKDTQKKSRQVTANVGLHSRQVTANVGLHYVCYQLSRRGWNVMPTARNAKGIDIVAYQGSGKGFIGIQVKTLSKRLAVPLPKSLGQEEEVPGDYWIIVTNVAADTDPPTAPDVFVMLPDEVKEKARQHPRGSRWLVREDYESPDYQDAWHRLEVREASQRA